MAEPNTCSPNCSLGGLFVDMVGRRDVRLSFFFPPSFVPCDKVLSEVG